jgi:hypothetical protein
MLVDHISKRSQKFQLSHFHICAPENVIYVLSCQVGQESEAVIFRNEVGILKLLKNRVLIYIPLSDKKQHDTTTRHDRTSGVTLTQKTKRYKD